MNVLIKPIISEKSMLDAAQGRFSFVVDKAAGKGQVKRAVEDQFGVKVLGVQTLINKGEMKRNLRTRVSKKSPDWKKAIVTLAEGQKIDVFETKATEGK